MTIKEKYKRTIEFFLTERPEAETELTYSNPFELIVAVILSAQCTDKRVNIITPALLQKYPDSFSMASAEPHEIFEYIKSCTYPNNKAKHLCGMSRMLANEFGGDLPSNPEILQRLPGVGRKTANVLASVLFGKQVIAVDTHVFRVSSRIGLVKNPKNPVDAENQLTKNIPPLLRHKAHHWLILHGRYICKAQKPLCHQCGLTEICNFFNKSVKMKEKIVINNI